MYIFGYNITLSIQNLYILVKFFWQKLYFQSKKYKLFGFSGPNLHFWVQNYSFYPEFVHFGEIFWQKLHFQSKKYNFFVFQDQMYICGYKTTLFIQNLYLLVKFFGKNFIVRVKSTIFLVFRDQMYIFGYKTTVFIQNLYFLVKYFGKNFIFSVKSTNVLFFLGLNVHFWVQNYSLYPKFVHFSEIFWQKLHFQCKKYNFFGFPDQMYIFVYHTTVFIQTLYILVKFFGKNFIFSVKSTFFVFF